MPTARRRKPVAERAGERIITTPGVCGGQPRIVGTRIPVAVLLRCRDLGLKNSRILESYPSLTAEDLAAAWAFAAGAKSA